MGLYQLIWIQERRRSPKAAPLKESCLCYSDNHAMPTMQKQHNTIFCLSGTFCFAGGYRVGRLWEHFLLDSLKGPIY